MTDHIDAALAQVSAALGRLHEQLMRHSDHTHEQIMALREGQVKTQVLLTQHLAESAKLRAEYRAAEKGMRMILWVVRSRTAWVTGFVIMLGWGMTVLHDLGWAPRW